MLASPIGADFRESISRRFESHRRGPKAVGKNRLRRVDSHKRFSLVVQGQTLRRLVGFVDWQRRQTLRNLGQWLLALRENGPE